MNIVDAIFYHNTTGMLLIFLFISVIYAYYLRPMEDNNVIKNNMIKKQQVSANKNYHKINKRSLCTHVFFILVTLNTTISGPITSQIINRIFYAPTIENLNNMNNIIESNSDISSSFIQFQNITEQFFGNSTVDPIINPMLQNNTKSNGIPIIDADGPPIHREIFLSPNIVKLLNKNVLFNNLERLSENQCLNIIRQTNNTISTLKLISETNLGIDEEQKLFTSYGVLNTSQQELTDKFIIRELEKNLEEIKKEEIKKEEIKKEEIKKEETPNTNTTNTNTTNTNTTNTNTTNTTNTNTTATNTNTTATNTNTTNNITKSAALTAVAAGFIKKFANNNQPSIEEAKKVIQNFNKEEEKKSNNYKVKIGIVLVLILILFFFRKKIKKLISK